MPSLAIKSTRSVMPLLLHVIDSMVVVGSMPLAQWALGQPTHQYTFECSLVGCILMFVVGEAVGIYRPSRGRSADVEVGLATIAWTLMLCGLLIVGLVTRTTESFARSSILTWYVFGGLLVVCNHMSIRALSELILRNGYGARKTAIVGMNRLGLEIAANAAIASDCGMQIVGFFDDRERERLESNSNKGIPFRGGSRELIASIRNNEIDTVLIALPMRAEKRIQSMLDSLANSTASVYLVPDFFVFELLHSRWAHVGGLPVVSVFENPVYGVDGWIKRAFDLTMSVVGLILISPILVICAVLIKTTSEGPVFFRQKRYGLDGKEILVWKFRTMNTCDNGPIVMQAVKDDPRVTKVGRLLRRTSLDELPQLFNVVAGNMSLVGPRPHASAHNEQFRSLIRGYMMRHKVKPGITGLAQVEGSRGETDTVEKMEARISLDHRYIRDWSLWMDLKILLKTFTVVLRQDAY